MGRSFVVINAPQRSEAWIQSRLGRLTGSVAGDMLARTKSGWSTSRTNLKLRLVLERLTGQSHESDYVSPAMQAGIDREAEARIAYEMHTGQLVQETGFLQSVSWMAGASLDGHVGEFERLVSIKCRQAKAHYEFLREGRVPADAFAQIQHEMWITGARVADYFCWNPDFPPSMQLRIVTVTQSEADIDTYAQQAMAFLREVDQELEAMQTMADVGAVLKAAV